MKRISIALLVFFALSGYGMVTSVDTNDGLSMETLDNKTLVQKGLEAFFLHYDAEGVKTYFAENYIQHNPNVPTGIAPVLGFLPALKEANTTITIHRLIAEGDLVVAHCTYDNAEAFGASQVVTFDIMRVAEGKIAEHWDGLTPWVAETASGRTQVDGPTEVTDVVQTQANKALVTQFMEDILFGKNPDKITDYISTEQYHQHNPAIADGLDGLGAALQHLASQNDMFEYHKVHQVVAEGNFVFVRSEGAWHGKPQAFNDLFRLEGGKIVEHWDVVQEVPSEMAHTNGMF